MTPQQTEFDFGKILEAFKPFENLLDTYYNNTSLTGRELKECRMKAGSQNRAILDFFKRNPGYIFSPDEVHKVMNLPMTPLTSIRRAMSTLTKQGYLERTNVKKLGSYGAEVYCWKLR